jgi:hypothetical protein
VAANGAIVASGAAATATDDFPEVAVVAVVAAVVTVAVVGAGFGVAAAAVADAATAAVAEDGVAAEVVDDVLEPLAEDEAAEPEPADDPDTPADEDVEPAPAAAEDDAVEADDVPPPPRPEASASAWFVEPDVLPYLIVNAPEGEVAPCSTAVLLLKSVSAMDSGVCTSPRTSSEVSRFSEYAMPPGERELLA